MSAEEVRGDVEKLSLLIAEKQQQDSNNTAELADYAAKNSVAKYQDLTPMNNMKERTSDFPKDANDYKARLHDIAWSSQNDIAFVGQANDLVVCLQIYL